MRKDLLLSTAVRNTIRITASLAAITLMAGCSTPSGPKFDSSQEALRPDKALVYFYRSRQESWNVRGRKFHLFANGTEVGILPSGTYFSRHMKPGRTLFVSDSSGLPLPLIPYLVEKVAKKQGHVEVPLKAGKASYVKLHASDEFTFIYGKLTLEDEHQAAKELRETHLAR